MYGCSPPAAAPTCAPRSSAAVRCCRCTRANCRPARSAARWRPGTRAAAAWWTRSASWCSPSRCPRCRCTSGARIRRTARAMAGERYRESYFAMYPGVWRHGDWVRITPRGGAIIYGRSDSTINRQGVRMGTSEIYRAAGAVEEVVDALVVDVPRRDRDAELWMILFVVLEEGVVLDEELRARIARRIREDCSPRHVPERDPADRAGAAHALGQGVGGADQEDPDGRPSGGGGERRFAGRPERAGLLRGACRGKGERGVPCRRAVRSTSPMNVPRSPT